LTNVTTPVMLSSVNFPKPDKLAQNAAPPVGDPSKMDLTGLVMEPKLDGFRLLANVTENGVCAYTRTGKSQKGKIPHIEAILSVLPPDTWLDGELVYFDDKGMPEWGQVQSCMGSNAGDPTGKLTYVVFDILAFAGLDIRPLPLSERRAALEQALQYDGHKVTLSEQHPASHDFHDRLVAQGMEGTIVKDPSKPYASGKRGHGWTKFKANDEMDVVIMGFKPGENSFTGMIGAIEFGQYKPCLNCRGRGKRLLNMAHDPKGMTPNGPCRCPDCNSDGKVLTYRGRCSGMDMKMRQYFTDNQQDLIDSKQVISLAYMGIMPSGSPRHPQYKRLRYDKPAQECDWT
jgi:ATP-dependent DNA ligase